MSRFQLQVPGDRVYALRVGILALSFVLLLLIAAVWVLGSRNPYTPAG